MMLREYKPPSIIPNLIVEIYDDNVQNLKIVVDKREQEEKVSELF